MLLDVTINPTKLYAGIGGSETNIQDGIDFRTDQGVSGLKFNLICKGPRDSGGGGGHQGHQGHQGGRGYQGYQGDEGCDPCFNYNIKDYDYQGLIKPQQPHLELRKPHLELQQLLLQ